jgi:ribonuclease VapC
MVVDASALLAILKGEREEKLFTGILASSSLNRISPVNWFETSVQAEKAGREDWLAFEGIVVRARIIITPIEEEQARLAQQAWRRFGKGRHPARLNLGDCFAYALAKMTGEPLLFKGADFARTDVLAAV